jgi:CRP-like cAMP-binding protein
MTHDPRQDSARETWQVDVVEYSFGQFVIREGELADCAYLVKQGEVEVLKKSPDGREIHIARLGVHEIFGEMCLFEDMPRRSASVRVISDRAQVMAISKENFRKQLDCLPEGIRNIILVLMSRLRKANHQLTLLS